MGIMQTLKGSIATIALEKVEEKVDGRELIASLRDALKTQFGDKHIQKMQHGALWNFVKELAEGLYAGEIGALRMELMNWARDLKEDL